MRSVTLSPLTLADFVLSSTSASPTLPCNSARLDLAAVTSPRAPTDVYAHDDDWQVGR